MEDAPEDSGRETERNREKIGLLFGGGKRMASCDTCAVLYQTLTPLLLLLSLGLLSGCSDERDPVGPELTCDQVLDGHCWNYLGLSGQEITAIAVVPDAIYAGAFSQLDFLEDEIFRRGSNHEWSPIGQPAWRSDSLRPSALLYLPSESPRLLAGFRPLYGHYDANRAVMYERSKAGEEWLPVAAVGSVDGLAAAPDNPLRLYVTKGQGVQESLDGGETWQFLLGDGGNQTWGGLHDIAVHPSGDGHIWVGGRNIGSDPQVWTSQDWGDHWQVSRFTFIPPFAGSNNAVFALATDAMNSSRIWAGVVGGVVRSEDGAAGDGQDSWEYVLVLADTLDANADPRNGRVYGLEWIDGSLYAAASMNNGYFDEERGWVLDLGLFRSENGGEDWDTLQVPDDAREATTMIVDGSHERLLVGTSSGIWAVESTGS